MTWKRLLLAATAAAAGVGGLAGVGRAETVDPTLTQDQANRLSLFHDYGINVVGSTNYTAVPANVGNANETGFTPVPGQYGTGLMTSLLGPYASTDPTGPGRPFDVTFSPVVGYDANPEARRLNRGSTFAGGDLGIAYHVADGPDDPVAGRPLRATFAYDVLGAVYEGQTQNADAVQQNISASVRQTLFDGTAVLNASIADGFTVEHGEAFLNTIDAGATAELFFAPQASIETGYNYTRLTYFFRSILPAQKPDADRSTFVVKGHLYTVPQRRGSALTDPPDVLGEILQGGLRRFTVTYNHVWNLADRHRNRDYPYEANRIGFGFEGITIPDRIGRSSLGRYGRDVNFDLMYAHEFQEYENANTASPPILAGRPKGRFHRQDGIDVFTVRGNARLADLPHDAGTLATFVQWDLIHDGSNIVARHYNEYVISGGLTYRY